MGLGLEPGSGWPESPGLGHGPCSLELTELPVCPAAVTPPRPRPALGRFQPSARWGRGDLPPPPRARPRGAGPRRGPGTRGGARGDQDWHPDARAHTCRPGVPASCRPIASPLPRQGAGPGGRGRDRVIGGGARRPGAGPQPRPGGRAAARGGRAGSGTRGRRRPERGRRVAPGVGSGFESGSGFARGPSPPPTPGHDLAGLDPPLPLSPPSQPKLCGLWSVRPVLSSDRRPCFSPHPVLPFHLPLSPYPSAPSLLPYPRPRSPPTPHPTPPRSVSVSLPPRRPPGARPQARGRRPGVRLGWALSWRLGRRGEPQLFAISRGPRRPRPSLHGWGPAHPHLWGGETPETSKPVSEGVLKGDRVGR